MMDYKEIDKKILAKVTGIATVVAQKYMSVDLSGKYTAAQLYQKKNAMGEKILILYDYEALISDKVYDDKEQGLFIVQVDTFKCSFPVEKLFEIMYRFEKICGVTPKNKVHFKFGEEEYETISGKAMYLNKDDKPILRKKSLQKISDHVAIERDKKTKIYNLFYLYAGVWYLLARNYDENQCKVINERVEKDEKYIPNLVLKWDFETKTPFSPIYKALYDSLLFDTEYVTTEEKRCENEPGNEVRCENANIEYHEEMLDEQIEDHLQDNIHKLERAVRAEYIKRENPKYSTDYPYMFAVFIKCGSRYYTSGWSSDMLLKIPNIREHTKKCYMYLIIEGNDFPQIARMIFKTKGNRDVIALIDIKESRKHKWKNIKYDVIRSIDEVRTYFGVGDESDESDTSNNGASSSPSRSRTNDRRGISVDKVSCARLSILSSKKRYFPTFTSYQSRKEISLEQKRMCNKRVYIVLIRGDTEYNSE